jgi:hypothetical protein
MPSPVALGKRKESEDDPSNSSQDTKHSHTASDQLLERFSELKFSPEELIDLLSSKYERVCFSLFTE